MRSAFYASVVRRRTAVENALLGQQDGLDKSLKVSGGKTGLDHFETLHD